MGESPSLLRVRIQWLGLIGGPVLAWVTYMLLAASTPALPVGGGAGTAVLDHAGRATLAVMVWMAVWWLTEAIDISATALLPLVAFPLLGVADIKAAAVPYANPLIFLFMGGFILALSMQRWGLDKRIALITLRFVGTKPVNMVGGFMLVTAVLSAFVSNTATTAMMLPIALSVIELIRREAGDTSSQYGRNFALCLMLGIAYAASIGGVATIIGTPPNTFLVSFVADANKIGADHRMEISFAKWLLIGVPLTVVFLPIVWLLLTRVLYPIRIRRIEGGRELIDTQYAQLGRASRGEWATFIVFMCTAALWITRPLLNAAPSAGWFINLQSSVPWLMHPVATFLRGLTDYGIAMLGGLVLFVIPVNARQRVFVMDWPTATRLPWGILILFGGGLSLAEAVKANGVAEFIGASASHFAGMPDIVIVLAVTAMVIFLTELTSNTATTATLVPILAALAPGLGVHPYLMIFPAALAASCAFMMPVATPPNAIVFGSGHVTIPQMCRAGVWLNLIGIALITALAMSLLGPVLGVTW